MSLYDHLTKLNNAAFPATDVIKSLIDILSHELCASNLRRSSHTFCAFISRSRDLCDYINFLIGKSITEDGWTSYDEYTAMIEPLETLLLSISEVTDTSCVENLTDTVEISEWIDGAISWSVDRQKVKDSLSSVCSGKAFQSLAQTVTSEDIAHAAKHDDNVFMDNLVRALERRLAANWKTKFSADGHKHLILIQKELRGIRSKFQSCRLDELIVIAIKSAILVNGLTEVTINTSLARVRERFGSFAVISKAYELIKYISVNFDQSHLSEMQEKYSNLVILLNESLGEDSPEDIGMPESFRELRKFPGQIRPPYYLQTLILVQYCNTLVSHYRTTKPKPLRKPVDDALSATVTALQGAAKLGSQTSSGSTFDFGSMQSGEVTSTYQTATTTIQSSCSSYKIEFDASRMQTAKENDKKRLQAWKNRMKARDRNESRTQLSIVVKFKDASGRTSSARFSDLTISVLSTTSLDVILWEIVSRMEPGMRDRVRSNSHFETASPREVLELSDPVSKVGPRNLQLILDA
ncbi:uncharacterized protein EV420DRAFT_1496843 [Desarmillaria tabescens]|uniref:Uncharacterized protein n=1 Tax=Armillaria tabescens TaxID=1929756 RepID=A0AA39NQ62_ARMTA|nr:uncharacterized protein EV420DRAFT_1496843 [Desarmillaria tabescens]KAK0469824.1 hypothetical protein EV420DRAFT_1496843 [Desarmillaria tabescens]